MLHYIKLDCLLDFLATLILCFGLHEPKSQNFACNTYYTMNKKRLTFHSTLFCFHIYIHIYKILLNVILHCTTLGMCVMRTFGEYTVYLKQITRYDFSKTVSAHLSSLANNANLELFIVLQRK